MRKALSLVSWSLVLSFWSLGVQAQEYRLIDSIATEATFFATDKLQNIYLVSPQNEVVKYDKNGLQLFRYNNNRLGDLTFLDTNNPFKLMLFYPEFANLIFLDRTMTPAGDFRFFDFNFIQVDAVALASDNNIWLYDKLNFQLKKIDNVGRLIFESPDLSMALNQGLNPNFLIEREQQVYLNDPETGILVFDLFGQYEKTLEFKGIEKFQILDGKLLFFQEGKLNAFNLQSLLFQEVILPEGIGEKAQVLMQKNRLFVLEEGALRIYRF